jgi:hypothetical protein
MNSDIGGKGDLQYIPKTKKCDGIIDCLDYSDECNDECSTQILNGNFLKVFSWTIGAIAVIANLVIIGRTSIMAKNSKVLVALINRSLILLICFGDLLVGVYLLFISIQDTIKRKSYCRSQAEWLTSYQCSLLGIISTTGSQLSLFAMTGLSIFRLVGISYPMIGSKPLNAKLCLKVFAAESIIVLIAIAISTTPLISTLEDYYVNGLRYDPEMKLFVGLPDKFRLIEMLEASYGRMRKSILSWSRINIMISDMFSHDLNYKDLSQEYRQVEFYGNDGVCLFKYFVNPNDPQRNFSWSIIAINFTCFVIISLSYLMIGSISKRSSSNVLQRNDRQLQKRNKRMNTKISIIIATDFLCWVPFIIICILHSTEVLNGAKWYAVFSIIILPINSVINPLLYDDFLWGALYRKVSNSIIRNSTHKQKRTRGSQNLTQSSKSDANAGETASVILTCKTNTRNQPEIQGETTI